MTKAELKIRYQLLIDISSEGVCTRSDRDLALVTGTTSTYVAIILQAMAVDREIDMVQTQEGRTIIYIKGHRGKHGTSKRGSTII